MLAEMEFSSDAESGMKNNFCQEAVNECLLVWGVVRR